MDFSEVRDATLQAIDEVDDDVDPSYVTEETFKAVEADAREVDDEAVAHFGPEAEAACNYLRDPFFAGGPGTTVYGWVASANGTCQQTWQVRMTWQSRSLHRKCSNRANSYIWKVC